MKEIFNVALAQISCQQANKSVNVAKIKKIVTKAKKMGAELVIFP